jgi:deoxyhypusine monooxygenase
MLSLPSDNKAAEAMGAVSSESSIALLRRYANDPEVSVRETVEIALAKIEWDHSPEGRQHAQDLAAAESA